MEEVYRRSTWQHSAETFMYLAVAFSIFPNSYSRILSSSQFWYRAVGAPEYRVGEERCELLNI